MFWGMTLLYMLVASATARCGGDKTAATKTSSTVVAKESSTTLSATTKSPSSQVAPMETSPSPPANGQSLHARGQIGTGATPGCPRPRPTTSRDIRYAGPHTANNNTVEKFLNIPHGADTGGQGRFGDPAAARRPGARGTVVGVGVVQRGLPEAQGRPPRGRGGGARAGDGLPVMACACR